MRRKSRLTGVLSALVVVVAAFGLVTPARASAAVDTRGRDVDPRPSTARLAFELQKLEWLSLGAMDVTEIGRSNEGRPVWSARVGHGPVRIMFLTQQHGDEPLGTPAALEFLRRIGIGYSAGQRELRSRVTVDIVVRANPDGFEHGWRYNYDPQAEPEFGERGKGYDINRYHNPTLAPGQNPATEAGIIQRHYAAVAPTIMVDYHMQGRYLDANGKEITASVLWPTHPDVTTPAVEFAKQISVVAQRSMNAVGGNVSQYPGGDYAGIARNAYGLRGSGSVLIELSDLGTEHEQEQIRSATASMMAIAKAAADGSLAKIDPKLADAIPPRGAEIGTSQRLREFD